MRPRERRGGMFAEMVQRVLVDFEAERIIDGALRELSCNVCGHKGLKRVARIPGEIGYEAGKQKAVCASCGANQWKPCVMCNGDGKVAGSECGDCGGSGMTGKKATPDGSEKA